MFLQIFLITADGLDPCQRLLNLAIHRLAKQGLRDSARIRLQQRNRVLHLFLVTFTSGVQCLKVVTHFGHNVLQLVAKTLHFDNDLFGSLADLQVLFNLLQSVAFFGPFELVDQPINSGLHRFGTRRHVDKTDVPFFVHLGAGAIRFKRIWIELCFDLFSQIRQPFGAEFCQLFCHPRWFIVDRFGNFFQLAIITASGIKTKSVETTFFDNEATLR